MASLLRPALAGRLLPLLAAIPLAAQQPPPDAPLALSASEVTRLGATVSGAGARATGMGGAFVGVADDATAASFNPAGLAQLQTFEASIVARKADFHLDYPLQTDPATGEQALKDQYDGKSRFNPQFFSLTVPMTVGGRNLVFQMSRQRMLDLDQTYSRDIESYTPAQDARRQFHEQAVQAGSMEVWSLAGAYELSPRLLVGLAVNQWSGRWDYNGTAQGEASSTRTHRSAGMTLSQQNRFTGRNSTLGLLWRFDAVRVGLSYQAPFTAKYRYQGHLEGFRNVAGPLAVISQDLNPSGTVHEVHWPETLAMGVSWRFLSQWMVAADVSRTPWSKARFEAPGTAFGDRPFLDPAPTGLWGDPSTPSQRAKDVVDVRLGGEYLAFLGPYLVPVRAGAFREPQPLVDPATGENRVLQGFTLGTGIKRGGVALDLAYKVGRSRRQALHSETTLAPLGDYEVPGTVSQERLTVKTFVASLIFQFKGEAIRKAGRWLFIGGE